MHAPEVLRARREQGRCVVAETPRRSPDSPMARLTPTVDRDVAEHVDAELEVVDRDPLVGRVDEARGQLDVHRPQREEPVRGRPERLAQVVAVGEPGAADRRERRSRLELVDPALERAPERRVERRARPADDLARATRSPSRPGRPRARSGSISAGRLARAAAGSRPSIVQRPGITLRWLRRLDHRRRERRREQRRDSSAASGWSVAGPVERELERRRSRRARPRGTPRTSGISWLRRLEPAERLEHGRGLEERVVGDVRVGRVAAAAADAERNGARHLLRDRAEVERPAAEDDTARRRPR